MSGRSEQRLRCPCGVTQPRLIRPKSIYAICRRVERRRFLLRPDAIFNALFIWVLAVCAKQFEVDVHVATVMSTHFHLVVSVPNENVSELMHRLDMRLARALQVYRRFVQGVIWQPGKLSIVELKTVDAVVEEIAYAIVNPVKAGLVYRSSDWPGVTATVEELGRKVMTENKPTFYFTSDNWPDTESVPLTLPACLGDDHDAARALIAAEVELQEAEARAEVKQSGWEVLGRVRAMNVSPYKRAKSWEPLGKLFPHIAAGRGRTAERIAAIEELREFRAKHAAAKARWIAGDRDVVFPAGTYWMRVHHRVRVEPFD